MVFRRLKNLNKMHKLKVNMKDPLVYSMKIEMVVGTPSTFFSSEIIKCFPIIHVNDLSIL